MQDSYHWGNWMKGICDFSLLFLTSACESTVISKQKVKRCTHMIKKTQ